MKKRHYTCENCGAELIIDANAESGRCEYCGSVYYIDKQKPAEVHHYLGNIKITPARIVAAISVIAVLAAAIVVLSLYFAGVFGDKKPPVSNKFEHEKAYLFEGTYLVGEDMTAGEFVAFKAPSAQRGRILILTDPKASAGTSACLYDYRFANNAYFTVESGLYVKVEDCNVFRVGDKTVDPMADGSFEGNVVLRGGADIPAGNYVLHNEDKTSGQHVEVTCVKGGKEYKKRIGFRSHFNIDNGDYLYITYGKLYAEKDAPAPLKGDSGEFLRGQYKVGLDIPAGRYDLRYGTAGSVARFAVNKSGSAFFDDDELISPTATSGYVDLYEGDYIYLYLIDLVSRDGAEWNS